MGPKRAPSTAEAIESAALWRGFAVLSLPIVSLLRVSSSLLENYSEPPRHQGRWWVINLLLLQRARRFWSLRGFGSKVIYETTFRFRRVNNKFHKAGSCKLWLKIRNRRQIVEFSLYLEFHSSFLNLIWKSLTLPTVSRCYMWSLLFDSKHQFHINICHHFISWYMSSSRKPPCSPPDVAPYLVVYKLLMCTLTQYWVIFMLGMTCSEQNRHCMLTASFLQSPLWESFLNANKTQFSLIKWRGKNLNCKGKAKYISQDT